MLNDIIEHNERVFAKRKKGMTLLKAFVISYAVMMAYFVISTLYFSILIIYK